MIRHVGPSQFQIVGKFRRIRRTIDQRHQQPSTRIISQRHPDTGQHIKIHNGRRRHDRDYTANTELSSRAHHHHKQF